MSTQEEIQQLVGKTVVKATHHDEHFANEWVLLEFSDGTLMHAGMGCGSTCEDHPYFSLWIDSNPKAI